MITFPRFQVEITDVTIYRFYFLYVITWIKHYIIRWFDEKSLVEKWVGLSSSRSPTIPSTLESRWKVAVCARGGCVARSTRSKYWDGVYLAGRYMIWRGQYNALYSNMGARESWPGATARRGAASPPSPSPAAPPPLPSPSPASSPSSYPDLSARAPALPHPYK